MKVNRKPIPLPSVYSSLTSPPHMRNISAYNPNDQSFNSMVCFSIYLDYSDHLHGPEVESTYASSTTSGHWETTTSREDVNPPSPRPTSRSSSQHSMDAAADKTSQWRKGKEEEKERLEDLVLQTRLRTRLARDRVRQAVESREPTREVRRRQKTVRYLESCRDILKAQLKTVDSSLRYEETIRDLAELAASLGVPGEELENELTPLASGTDGT